MYIHVHRVLYTCRMNATIMKALKCGTLGASFGKPCASGYVEGILDEYIHSIVCMYMYIHVYNYFRVVGAVEI